MPHARTPDQCSLYYDVRGRGDEALVLLSGQANTHRWWDAVREDFDPHFRTVALDYRGTGRSDKPEDGSRDVYSTRRFAEDLVAVLDHLGIARAHVYGTSMGGRVAQWFAAEHPDRTGALVLGCTSPGTHGVERAAEVQRALAQPDPEAARRCLLELMYTPAWLATRQGPFHTLGDPEMPAHARRGHLRASARHDAWEALPRISADTLVLHGTDDMLTPAANATLLVERIPHARLRLIEGARHGYFEEFRAEASALVLEFLLDRPLSEPPQSTLDTGKPTS